MKKIKLLSALSCLATLVSCQNAVPTLSFRDSLRKATLLSPENTKCLVIDNAQFPSPTADKGTSVSYTLQFDTNQDNKPDVEMNVCADTTHLTQPEVQNYIQSVIAMSPQEQKSLRSWQKYINNNPLLKGKKPEMMMLNIAQKNENTR